MIPSVQRTAELRRVVALPRRTWSDARAAELAATLTPLFATLGGAMQLRPIQAVALAEAGTRGGLFASIRVGGGKTLLSLLAAIALEARRPLLLVPANLVGKTERAARELARHWRLPDFLRVVSYQLLGRKSAAALLDRYQPDLIVCDEAHWLKNLRAAVTKRLLRYHARRPDCRLVAMSGTPTKRSLRDYAHLLRWALGAERAPVPAGRTELEEWADALDEKPGLEIPMRLPGALADLRGAPEAGLGALEGARRAYRRRLTETPGVVATAEGELGTSLAITAITPPLGSAVDAAFADLRAAWRLPDGTELADGMAVWRHARELALGFFYHWDPPPPRPWLEARKAWAAECRYILTNNRRNLDTELQVALAVAEGLYPRATTAYAAWVAVRDTFRPTTVPVWLDDGALDAAATWLAEGSGLAWTEHVAFACELAKRTGLPYYGRQGRTAEGRPIPEFGEPGCGEGAAIVSLSNRTGRNLQGWSRNLVTAAPANGEWWEQLLGRTHRDGQEADAVTFEVFVSCQEHARAFAQACRDAQYIEATTGQIQKLGYADTDVPGEEGQR